MSFRDYISEGNVKDVEKGKFGGVVDVDNVTLEIIKLFQQKEKLVDADIHELSDKLKINTHKFETIIYGLLQSFFAHGRAMDKGEFDVDPKELAMGMKVEKEHTTSDIMAYRIAMDHLAELPDYYTKLSKMENE